MFRVYEVINNDSETIKEHGDFFTLVEAQNYSKTHWKHKPQSTFVVNYRREDKSVCEQYYGRWTNQ